MRREIDPGTALVGLAFFAMWTAWLMYAPFGMAHEPAACVCPAPPPCAVAPAELLEQIEQATATIEAAK